MFGAWHAVHEQAGQGEQGKRKAVKRTSLSSLHITCMCMVHDAHAHTDKGKPAKKSKTYPVATLRTWRTRHSRWSGSPVDCTCRVAVHRISRSLFRTRSTSWTTLGCRCSLNSEKGLVAVRNCRCCVKAGVSLQDCTKHVTTMSERIVANRCTRTSRSALRVCVLLRLVESVIFR